MAWEGIARRREVASVDDAEFSMSMLLTNSQIRKSYRYLSSPIHRYPLSSPTVRRLTNTAFALSPTNASFGISLGIKTALINQFVLDQRAWYRTRTNNESRDSMFVRIVGLLLMVVVVVIWCRME